MQALIDVILPVFLVVGLGYAATWRGAFSDASIDALMKFSQNFAIPVLLFRAIATLDLSSGYDAALIFSFYTGAALCFALGLLIAHTVFNRGWEDSVAIGFCCLFSNSVMLGLPITERAFGPEALDGNYMIVSIHSPFCYGLGITAMEIARAKNGLGQGSIARNVLGAMFRNTLVIGILAGVFVNITKLPLPGALWDAIDLMVLGAIPTALFGMGGVLYRYRPEGDLRLIGTVVLISLVVHPSIVTLMARLTELSTAHMRSAVLTAAMGPGINTYIFANMYGRARRVAASSVLIATALSIITASLWLTVIS